MNADAIFGGNNNLVNGDILIAVRDGAIYVNNNAYMVYFPGNFPAAVGTGDFVQTPLTRNHATAFIAVNTYHIMQADNSILVNAAIELSYIRMLASKYRMISPAYLAANFNCDYNQACYVRNVADTANLDSAAILAADDEGFPRAQQAAIQAGMAQVLTRDKMIELNTTFINLACLVAYIFRIRGHHYMTDMQAKYVHTWGKTATKNYAFHNSWEKLTTVALHAVMPMVLDQFWTKMVNEEKCDVILRIRYTSAAAGTALFPVLAQGIKDLAVTVPRIRDVLAEEIEYVERTANNVKNNRWDHSINARFYGAEVGRISEVETGAVGALIKACVEQLVPEADLAKSKALERAAKLAPITGASMGIAIKNFIKSEKFMMLEQARGNDT